MPYLLAMDMKALFEISGSPIAVSRMRMLDLCKRNYFLVTSNASCHHSNMLQEFPSKAGQESKISAVSKSENDELLIHSLAFQCFLNRGFRVGECIGLLTPTK